VLDYLFARDRRRLRYRNSHTYRYKDSVFDWPAVWIRKEDKEGNPITDVELAMLAAKSNAAQHKDTTYTFSMFLSIVRNLMKLPGCCASAVTTPKGKKKPTLANQGEQPGLKPDHERISAAMVHFFFC
jgi:hypothetical protein